MDISSNLRYDLQIIVIKTSAFEVQRFFIHHFSPCVLMRNQYIELRLY